MQFKKLTFSILISLLPFLLSCTSAEPKNYSHTGVLTKQSLVHDGYEREYIIYKQASIQNLNKLPLLIALHGGGGTSKQLISHTKRRFNILADAESFYVVYPQGLKKGWNDGRNDLKQFATVNNIDDVGYIQKLIHYLTSKYNIDVKRIFVTGISNGGFMSFRLACELEDEINAIAPLTATISEDVFKSCNGNSNVGLMLMNGTEDPIVPYDGGYVELFGKKRGKIASTRMTIDRWLEMLRCKNEPIISELPDNEKDGTTVTTFEYRQCNGNGTISLYRINGGGHTWPGAKSHNLKRIVGKTSQELIACDTIWEFFKHQP
ncbi:MAG: PHB depolymerase family esterase [Pseudomonadota bacterium]